MTNVYLGYKESDVEWLGRFPEHWKLARIKHILKRKKNSIKTGPFGSQLKSSDMVGSDVKVYNQRNVIDKDFVNGDNYISFQKFDELKEFEIFAGDFLITTRGTIGRCAVFPNDANKGVLHPCLIRIQPDEKVVDDRFLLWFIHESALFKESIFYESNATTIEVIYSNTLKQVIIPVPPLLEQQIIADFLDCKTTQIDTLIEKKQRQIDLLQEQRTALINHAVTKGLNPDAPMKDSGVEWLGEVPSHWEVKRIKHLVQSKKNAIKTGPFGSQLTNADMMGTDIKVYNQRSVIDKDFINGDNYVSLEKFQQLKEFEIFAGDILITTRGTIGRCAIFPSDAEKGILHPCLIRLQLDEQLILKEYLIWFIQDSVLFQQSIFFESNATTIDVIYSGTMKQVVVPVPPVEEQSEIVNYLYEVQSKTQQAKGKLEREISLLQEYRTALISEAVTGKIDVREWRRKRTIHE